MSTDILTEEPEAGAVVIDVERDMWERTGGTWFRLRAAETRTWAELIAEFGPVHLVASPPQARPTDYAIRLAALTLAVAHVGPGTSRLAVYAASEDFERELRETL